MPDRSNPAGGQAERATEAGPRRRHPRGEIALLVQYRYGVLEEFRTDYTLNVSRSGLFITATEKRPLGTRVYVQLTTQDGQHFLQGEGRVVRHAAGGYAIELAFEPDAAAVLAGLVEESQLAPTRRKNRKERRLRS